MIRYILTFLTGLSLFACGEKSHEPEAPPNVLFIAVDDLRPELACYGQDYIHSPNIDAFAASGTLFMNSYCNIPVCGASRASLMTGLRPTLTRFKRYYTRADEDAPEVETLAGIFKSNGYKTISNGKIFHHSDDSEEDWDEIWKPGALSPRDFHAPENIALDTVEDQRGPPYENAAENDHDYRDGKLTLKAVEDLKKLKSEEKPFFLAVGYIKPHLPFTAPKKYWDLYSPESIVLPKNSAKPTDVPAKALHTSGELRHYHGVPEKGPVSEEMAKNLIRGYYACVSYTDALVGQLLNTLDSLGLSENTVVVLWGDHGWNLLEHGLWCKHCNYRNSLKAPLMFRLPGKKSGVVRDEMVEFVDIYPTLVEACNLPNPGHLQGNSLVSLINDEEIPWKSRVESVWNDGFTYTSNAYAYTEWRTETDSIEAQMLFDHRNDPAEDHNIMSAEGSDQIAESLKSKD